MPATYICNIFEAAFPNSLAFPVESVIVGVVDIQSLHCDGPNYQSKLDEILLLLLQSLKLRAGISNDFSNLFTQRYITGRRKLPLRMAAC